jgi:hypothetical protein
MHAEFGLYPMGCFKWINAAHVPQQIIEKAIGIFYVTSETSEAELLALMEPYKTGEEMEPNQVGDQGSVAPE